MILGTMLIRTCSLMLFSLVLGCASQGPLQSAVLDTQLPPGNATDVALSPSERFLATANPARGSVTVFMLSRRADGVRLDALAGLRPAEVELSTSGALERIVWSEGIDHGEALYILVREDGSDSIRRVYASGEKFSLSIDEEEVAEATKGDISRYFPENDPVADDERLRIREEIRRAREHSPVEVDLPSDMIVDACSWQDEDGRFIFATFKNTDAVAMFDVTQRGQAELVRLIPSALPGGIAIGRESGILYIGEQRTSRVVAFNVRELKR